MRLAIVGVLSLFVAAYVGCGSSENGGAAGGSFAGSSAAGGKAGSSAGGSAGSSIISGGASGTSSAGTSSAGTSSSTGGSGTGGAQASGGSSVGGSSGFGGSGIPDATLTDVIFTYDAPVITSDACASLSAKAESLPLDVYIVQDNSGSMSEPAQTCILGICVPANGDCNIGDTVDSKWCHSINALNGFFSAPSSVGGGVALAFFNPNNNCTPVSPLVPLDTLPNNLSQLQTALNNAGPNGSTPTSAAAQGIINFTLSGRRPGRKIIGVIVTDGDPTQCDTSVTNINSLLVNHYTSTGIATYMIGMTGATYSNLETMAAGAGAPSHTNFCGTGPNPCHYYDVGNGDPAAFIDALNLIQSTALACSYTMPMPSSGVVDLSKVSVSYTPGGQTAQTLPKVNDSTQCSGPGWYFDNNTSPTGVQLCPDTCNTVQGDPTGEIDVTLGCIRG